MDDKTKKALHELKKKYSVSIQLKIPNIKKYVDEGNLEALQQEFHKLKGSGKLYGFNEISIISTITEKKLKSKSSDALSSATKASLLLEKIIDSYFKTENYDVLNDPLFKDLSG